MTTGLLTVTLEKLTYGGEAMGRLEDPTTEMLREGRAVFVPYALPGERVRIRLVEEKRGYARAELLEVIQPAPERIQPKCPHFGVCGGCHYQHMPYEAQLSAKTGILRDQLIRIGCIENPPIQPMVPSPDPWNYRNHMQFHMTEDGKLGFQTPNSNTVIPITECHLPEAPINTLWPQIEAEAIPGLEHLSIRAGANEDLMLILESESLDLPEMEIEAGISVVHLSPAGPLVLASSNHILMEVRGRTFRVSAGSFFQVNTAQAAALVEHLLASLPLPAETILDVYCGVGLFSAFLAPNVKRLIGIESSPSACEDFVINLDEFDNVELYEALAEDALPVLDIHPEVILVDPPRAGLDRRALDAILALKPRTLTYVSCDPSTLARDARRLIAGGYHLKQVTPFDMFPQTYHIESISLFINY